MQSIQEFVNKYLNQQTKTLTVPFGEFDSSWLESSEQVKNFLKKLSQWEFGAVLNVKTHPNESYTTLLLYRHLEKDSFMIDSLNSAEKVNVKRETQCRVMIELLVSELNLNMDFSEIYISL